MVPIPAQVVSFLLTETIIRLYLITGIEINEGKTMARGGKREGAGRPANPTKQVRIPVDAASAARIIAEIYLAKAWQKLKETAWYKTAPQDCVSLRLAGVETLPVSSPLGGNGRRDFVVAVAKNSISGEIQEVLIEI